MSNMSVKSIRSTGHKGNYSRGGMNMHAWGEGGVDWKGIGDAARYIGEFLRKWGRVAVLDMEEKWGTVRVYCYFGWTQVHSITHPGHVRNRYPSWIWKVDCLYLSRIVTLLNPIAVRLHQRMYTYVYGQALKKWPHLREEILAGADYPELLSKYGVHVIRTGKNTYETQIGWHPDNFTARRQKNGNQKEV